MFRRLLGLVILIVSLIMVIVLLAGAFFSGQVIDAVGEGVNNVLALTVDSLDTVSATLEQTKATITEANNAMATATTLTENLSKTVGDTQPVMASMTAVVSEDVPNNIEAIQAAIPNVAEVAGVVDTAMTKLSSFGISQVIPIPFNPITLDFDLGIDYEPAEPFDETILSLGDSMEGMPDELRSLKGDLDVLSADLEVISNDILTASGDLESINQQIALFIPLLDQYLGIIEQIGDSLGQAQAQILAQLGTVKTVIFLLMVFLSLTQLTPLYIGWELVTGQRNGQKEAEPADEEAAKPSAERAEKAPPPPVEEEVAEELPESAAEKAPEASPEPVYDPGSETVIEGRNNDPEAGEEAAAPVKGDGE